jgi:hypothetical protein
MVESRVADGRRAVIMTSAAVATGLVFGLALTPTIAAADVVSSAPGGFVIRIEMPVAAAPADVYAKFFEVDRWWSGQHTYTGKAANLSLKNEPGACFCEALPGGGFVRHATLEYSDKGRIARLSGALGPLQELGAHGLLAFNFTPADKANTAAGTKLVVSYVVSGYQPDKGFEPIAAPVNSVLTEQVTRLKHLVETGKP